VVSEPPGSQGTDREVAGTSEHTAPDASEEDLEEESRRTGIPVNILRRTREARKRAAGGVGEQSTPAGPGGEGPGPATRGGP